MITIGKIIVGLVTGVLLGSGIWAFFDGIVYTKDKFPWVHILPFLGSLIAFICLNLATFEQAKTMGVVKIWTFICMTIGFISIGGAIWITATEYPPNIIDSWPGVAIIFQTTVTLMASLLFFIGRSSIAERKY